MLKPGSMGQFAAKTAIVCVAIFLMFWGLASVLDSVIQQRIAQISQIVESYSKIGGRQFWAKVEQAIEKQADQKSDISPEKKKKLMGEIRILVDRWRPFVLEAMAITEPDTKMRQNQ